jgi:hypothetical protein
VTRQTGGSAAATRAPRSRRAWLPMVAAVAVAVLAAGCSNSSDSSGSPRPLPTTTVPEQGTAKIVKFDVPASVQCGALNSTTVPVTWATEGAKSQQISVDGRPVDGTDSATGSVNADVHCDALEHTVVIIALDAKGRRSFGQSILKTVLPPGR